MAELIHKPKEFVVGDVVRVTAKPDGDVKCWYTQWVSNMDAFVGRTMRVKTVHPMWGFQCVNLQVGQTVAFWFPSCCLELCAEQPVKPAPESGQVVIDVPSV
jgi:hypothetical protein